MWISNTWKIRNFVILSVFSSPCDLWHQLALVHGPVLPSFPPKRCPEESKLFPQNESDCPSVSFSPFVRELGGRQSYRVSSQERAKLCVFHSEIAGKSTQLSPSLTRKPCTFLNLDEPRLASFRSSVCVWWDICIYSQPDGWTMEECLTRTGWRWVRTYRVDKEKDRERGKGSGDHQAQQTERMAECIGASRSFHHDWRKIMQRILLHSCP